MQGRPDEAAPARTDGTERTDRPRGGAAPARGSARAELRLAERGGWVELLRAPALVFGGVARLRGTLYDRRVLPSYALDVPVLSVGNLSAGGTGKTPMTAWLVRALRLRGLRPAIVSRGYRAAAGAPNDEARMLAELFPDVLHLQGKDRVDAARRAVDAGADAVVVDDGFQHRRLARDLDIVLVDALRPFGLPRSAQRPIEPPVRALIPRGLMREPLAALGRADVCVITRADRVGEDEVAGLARTLQAAAPGLPLATAAHRPVRVRVLGPSGATVAEHAPEWLAGRAVDLLSGIGNPGAFEATAVALGAEVALHRALPDHHAFTAADLAGLGATRPLLTTAKDAARLAGLAGVPRPEALHVLDVELEILTGAAVLEALLDALPPSTNSARRAAIHEGLHG